MGGNGDARCLASELGRYFKFGYGMRGCFDDCEQKGTEATEKYPRTP